MKIDQAKKYSRLTVLYNIFAALIVIAILVPIQTDISNLFTQDLKTVAIIEQVFIILLVYFFFDSIHAVQAGIIRGQGQQAPGKEKHTANFQRVLNLKYFS